MDPSNNKSSELERRISTRNSVRISISGADDDYDLAGMVSDGFRPTQSGPGPEPPSTPTASPAAPQPLVANSSPDSHLNPPPNRPSSIAKPHRPHESLSLRLDGGMGPIEESSSSLTRTSSLSTQSAGYIPAADSPYQGPSGPSHPYEMYPQNVRVARTMSMTTTSTEPISESSYNGPRAPAHPYGLYTQDTIAESADIQSAPIPIGFNGLPDRYHRRIGAEGEDIADIIGPDGHTEQLPPYTRYPDEAYARKVRDIEESPRAVAGGATVVPVAPALDTSNLHAIPGAGGIGLATRNPEFESMDDLGSPQSRHSSRSFSEASQHDINMAAADFSEKGKQQKPWQKWMRRRVWGIVPLWSIFLTGIVLILMGVILGSVIGAFMSKQRKPPRGPFGEPSNSNTASLTFGATAIPTPTDLTPLPLGSYSMPLMTSRVLSACFADTTLAQAWQCHLVISGLRLNIQKTKPDSLGDYTAEITCNTSHTVQNNVYSYGEQPFLIDKPASLELVNDTFDTGRGPAWFKLLTYNKTVIVPENVLSATGTPEGSNKLRRSGGGGGGGGKFPIGSADFKRKGIISEGQKPWICNWPETYLELFIYAQQNNSMASIRFDKPPPPSTPATPAGPTTPNPPGWSDPTAMPTKYGAAGNPTKWDGHGESPKPTEPPTGSPAPPTPTEPPPSSSGPYGPIDTNDNFTPPPPVYPRVIKLEERHMYGRQKATCTQVEIQDMGQPAKPLKGPDGKPIVIEIEETPPSSHHGDGDMSRRSWPLDRRDPANSSAGQCGCVWFLT